MKPKKQALRVVTEDEAGTVSRFTMGPGPHADDAVYLKGSSLTDCTCGSCGRTLTRGVGLEQMQLLVLVCPKCEALNFADGRLVGS